MAEEKDTLPQEGQGNQAKQNKLRHRLRHDDIESQVDEMQERVGCGQGVPED